MCARAAPCAIPAARTTMTMTAAAPQVRGAPVNDEFMAFLEVSELLVEIADDLFDYEEDVLANVGSLPCIVEFIFLLCASNLAPP